MSEHSPYVQAALDSKPHLAILKVVGSDEPYIPHPGSQAARELLYNDPFAELPKTPPKPLQLPPQPKTGLSYQEMKMIAERYHRDQEIAKKARVSASAMWAAQLVDAQAPGALEAALVRVDALEERMRRYTQATGMPRDKILRREEKLENAACRMPASLVARIKDAAAIRGEVVAVTHRFLVECGLILMDERSRLYEVWILQQLQALAADAARREPDPALKREAVAEVLTEVQPERYVDSARMEAARLRLDPLHGAPPSVRQLLEAPRALSA